MKASADRHKGPQDEKTTRAGLPKGQEMTGDPADLVGATISSSLSTNTVEFTNTSSGRAIRAIETDGPGIAAISTNNPAVVGYSDNSVGGHFWAGMPDRAALGAVGKDGLSSSCGLSILGWTVMTGDLLVGGIKNAVIETPTYGRRYTYAEESAEVYFFDRGQAHLSSGLVTIHLDPIFLETVTITEDCPMLVQITPTADCNGLFTAEKTNTSFTVKELQNGTSNASFDWEVAAKRRGYEAVRLEEEPGERVQAQKALKAQMMELPER